MTGKSPNDPYPSRQTFQRVRWVLAFVLTIGLLVLARTGELQECGEQLTPAAGTIEVCEASEISDPMFVFGLLAIALLVLPDFSELGVGQLLTLKRRVEVQERQQESLRQLVDSVSLRVDSVQAQAMNATQTVNIFPYEPGTAPAAAEELNERLGTPRSSEHGRPTGSDERPSLVVELLRVWAELDRRSLADYLTADGTPRRTRPSAVRCGDGAVCIGGRRFTRVARAVSQYQLRQTSAKDSGSACRVLGGGTGGEGDSVKDTATSVSRFAASDKAGRLHSRSSLRTPSHSSRTEPSRAPKQPRLPRLGGRQRVAGCVRLAWQP